MQKIEFKNANVLPLIYYTNNVFEKLNNSNKVILPQKILDNILKNVDDIQYPLIFKIISPIINFYVGVEEFCPNNNIYLSNNLIENNFLQFNQLVDIEYCSPPKGNFIKLKPHLTKFTEIENPKLILEQNIIKYYPVLSKNETISIVYQDNTYYIDVVDCKPNFVISTNNTDLTVDFDEPTDYKEIMEKQKKEKEELLKITREIEKKEKMELLQKQRLLKEKRKNKYKKKYNKFKAFSGKGNRLG